MKAQLSWQVLPQTVPQLANKIPHLERATCCRVCDEGASLLQRIGMLGKFKSPLFFCLNLGYIGYIEKHAPADGLRDLTQQTLQMQAEDFFWMWR